jgi:hypothetical protein
MPTFHSSPKHLAHIVERACKLLADIEHAGHEMATCTSTELGLQGALSSPAPWPDAGLRSLARSLHDEAAFAQRRLPLRPGDPCELLDVGYQLTDLRSTLRDLYQLPEPAAA